MLKQGTKVEYENTVGYIVDVRVKEFLPAFRQKVLVSYGGSVMTFWLALNQDGTTIKAEKLHKTNKPAPKGLYKNYKEVIKLSHQNRADYIGRI